MPKSDNQLSKLLFVYSLWIAAIVFSSSLIYLYFKNAGLSSFDILLAYLFWPIPALLSMGLLNKRQKIDSRVLMAFGSLLLALAFALLLVFPPSFLLLLTYSFLSGATCFFFWVPYNIEYFGIGHGKAATLGTVYFSMASLLGLVLPVAGGLIVQQLGYPAMFGVSLFLFLLPAATSFLLRKREYQHELGASLKETKGFKTLVFIEGITGGIATAAIAIISLNYFKDPLVFGLFLSGTTLFAVIASFLVSRISDASKKRRKYINIFGTLYGAATLIAGFTNSAVTWYAGVGFRNFTSTLFFPFTTTIIVDNKRDMARLMVGREWVLNGGRLVGIVLAVLLLLATSSLHVSLILAGVLILLYPIVIELKRRHISVD